MPPEEEAGEDAPPDPTCWEPRAEDGAVPEPGEEADFVPEDEEAPDPTCCLSVAVGGAFMAPEEPEDEDDVLLIAPFVPPLLDEPPEAKSPPELPEDCPLGVCAGTGAMAPAAKVAITTAEIPNALKLIACSYPTTALAETL